MKKIKEFKGIIIIIFILISGAFYWYELRPMQIKKNCHKISSTRKINWDKMIYENKDGSIGKSYSECLKEKGLFD